MSKQYENSISIKIQISNLEKPKHCFSCISRTKCSKKNFTCKNQFRYRRERPSNVWITNQLPTPPPRQINTTLRAYPRRAWLPTRRLSIRRCPSSRAVRIQLSKQASTTCRRPSQTKLFSVGRARCCLLHINYKMVYNTISAARSAKILFANNLT